MQINYYLDFAPLKLNSFVYFKQNYIYGKRQQYVYFTLGIELLKPVNFYQTQ
jgi:hypothetical protein